MPVLLRQPRRMTVTISEHVYQKLVEISSEQGRSISNLAAFLLERSVSEWDVDRQHTLKLMPVARRHLSGRVDANAGAAAQRVVG